MPRKAKDKVIEDLTKTEKTKAIKKKEPTKKEAASKTKVAKKSTSKKVATEKEVTKKTSTKKSATSKVAEKKATTSKAAVKEVTSKSTTTKKDSTKKVATKATSKKNATKEPKTASTATKSTTKKATTSKGTAKKTSSTTRAKTTRTKKASNKKVSFLGEYYDLPNQYEKTVVKILAQTPSILFVYWDISNTDRQSLMAHYGETFFQETTPFLLILNKTKDYQFEVEVNDYANSWYLHIPDSDCEYEVILMRKNKNSQIILENDGRMTVTASNNLEAPNDHILFEKLGKTVFFKDVKTQFVQEKNISSFAFICNMGRIYNIYDLYKEIYKNELNGDELGASLSSSNFSSNFK